MVEVDADAGYAGGDEEEVGAKHGGEEAGSEVVLAAALRHGPNVNDARMPVNTCGQRIFTMHGNTPANGRIPCGFLYV